MQIDFVKLSSTSSDFVKEGGGLARAISALGKAGRGVGRGAGRAAKVLRTPVTRSGSLGGLAKALTLGVPLAAMGGILGTQVMPRRWAEGLSDMLGRYSGSDYELPGLTDEARFSKLRDQWRGLRPPQDETQDDYSSRLADFQKERSNLSESFRRERERFGPEYEKRLLSPHSRLLSYDPFSRYSQYKSPE